MFDQTDKAIVTPTTYQLWPVGKERKGEPLMVGTQVDFDQADMRLPRDRYELYAPHNEEIHYYGNVDLLNREATDGLSFIVQAISNNTFEENKFQIERLMQENGVIRANILYKVYNALDNQPGSIIEKVSTLKPILSYLVMLGAEIMNLRGRRYGGTQTFQHIVQYGLNTEAFSYGVLSAVQMDVARSHYSSEFEDMFNLCGEANINAVRRVTKFGSYLHWFLAFEMSGVPQLIELFESMSIQDPLNPKAQFNYEAVDGNGNTPLLIALNTRNEKAVLALLKLYQDKGKPVGIHVPNREGLTPLHFAVIFGMKQVVKQLNDLSADFNARDRQGKTVWDYAALNQPEKEAKIYQLLSVFMHPLRADVSITHQHSELYLELENGSTSPACLYEAGETIKTGDEQKAHFVILSNCSPHKERLDRVHRIIKEKAATGDYLEKQQLGYIEKQIDDIRYRKKFDSLVDFLRKGKKEQNQVAEKVYGHIVSLLPTPISYQEILNSTRNYLADKGYPQTESTAEFQDGINKVIDETPAGLSVFHTCLEGQAEVQTYLASLGTNRNMVPEATVSKPLDKPVGHGRISGLLMQSIFQPITEHVACSREIQFQIDNFVERANFDPATN